ncbi:MAG: hypothetical protein PF638_08720 [Candidatus Delongbacteria bacterium]|jgi:hypothetical protein|nr:hypothetical protein [Candidatus Delongbacteria bacterium]
MKLLNKIVLVILVTFIITNCALTPTKNSFEKVDDADMKKVEIPVVNTEYKPSLDKNIHKEKSVLSRAYTLDKVEVSKKKNGILIRFRYDGEDPKENISTFFSGDRFFNITFFKGEFGSDIKQSFFNSSIIRNLQFFEFEESVQVTVRLKDDHKSTFIQTDDDFIIISVFS